MYVGEFRDLISSAPKRSNHCLALGQRGRAYATTQLCLQGLTFETLDSKWVTLNIYVCLDVVCRNLSTCYLPPLLSPPFSTPFLPSSPSVLSECRKNYLHMLRAAFLNAQASPEYFRLLRNYSNKVFPQCESTIQLLVGRCLYEMSQKLGIPGRSFSEEDEQTKDSSRDIYNTLDLLRLARRNQQSHSHVPNLLGAKHSLHSLGILYDAD